MTSSFEPSSQIIPHGSVFKSHGGRFGYRVIGPCCRLFDRNELPWPCCRLAWKGKEPAWNRIGKRFIPDMAAARCPSYQVEGVDAYGNTWTQSLTLYEEKLTVDLKQWWITRKPQASGDPILPANAFSGTSHD